MWRAPRIFGLQATSILKTTTFRFYGREQLQAYMGKMLPYPDINTVLSDGLGGTLTKDLAVAGTGDTPTLMVRPHLVQMIDLLEDMRKNQFRPFEGNGDWLEPVRRAPSHMLLDGPSGCGKSVTMTQLVHWARSAGWLVFWINNSMLWTTQGQITRNAQVPGLWDQNVQAKSYLEEVLVASGDKLSRLPTQRQFEIGKRFRSNGARLSDLCHFGIEYERYAAWAVWELRKELTLVTQYPVMVAFDDVGRLYGDSLYGNPLSEHFKSEFLPSRALTLTHCMYDHHSHALLNGVYVSALCRRDERINQGFWKAHAARPFNLVPVPEQLSRSQARSLTEHLVTTGQMEAVSAAWPDLLLTVTGGRPGLVWKHLLHSMHQMQAPVDWEDAHAMGINSRITELAGITALADAQVDEMEQYSKERKAAGGKTTSSRQRNAAKSKSKKAGKGKK